MGRLLSLSPFDFMVPRVRASGGALGTRLRQSIAVETLELTYSLLPMAVLPSTTSAALISARAYRCEPERIAS